MEAPFFMPARPGLSELSHSYRRVPMISLDRNIIILTASFFGLLLLALFLLFFIPWARKRFTLQSQAGGSKPARPGMTRPQLDALPCSVFLDTTDVELSLHAPSASDCAICLAGFANGDRVRVLPSCHHRFHVGCIDAWLVQKSSCPVCRESLLEASPSTHPPYEELLHTLPKYVSGLLEIY